MNQGEFLDQATDYLNGVLSPDETANFERELAANTAMQQKLANMRVFREALAQQVEAETSVAWGHMQARLQAELSPSGIRALWQHWRLRAGLLVAVAVAVLEAFFLLNAPAYRTAPVESETQAIQVLFAPDVPQRQVRELLDQVHAQISAGPGTSGEYTVRVPVDEASNALTTLRATPIVQDAYPLKPRQ
jgi:anti-sigma factor RsiW